MKEIKMIKGRIMKKTRIYTKKQYFKKYYKQKKNQKKYYNKKYYQVQRVKKYCDDKCKDELAQKRKLLHVKYKENYL